ncbi:MAG: PilZ domain-containing protein [Nannocystaceae bacterium]|nr:PilZ domain-containing protein [Nannocystaceae bacterium]
MSRPDQRQAERLPTQLPVDVTARGTTTRGATINLSLGGALVRVDLPEAPRVGDRWRMSVSLPTLAEPIEAEAEVRWIGLTGECGVQFTSGLRARQTWALGQWLDRIRKGTP